MFIRKKKLAGLVRGQIDEYLEERIQDTKFRNISDINFKSLENKAWFMGRNKLIEVYKRNFPKSFTQRMLSQTQFWKVVDLSEEVPISTGFANFLSKQVASILFHNGIIIQEGKIDDNSKEEVEVNDDFTSMMIDLATIGTYSQGTFIEFFTDGSYNVLDNTEAEYCAESGDIIVREDFVEGGKGYQLVKTYMYGATIRELYLISVNGRPSKKVKSLPLTSTNYTKDLSEKDVFSTNATQCIFIPTQEMYGQNIDLFHSLDESFSIINDVNRRSKPIEYFTDEHLNISQNGVGMPRPDKRKRSYGVIKASIGEKDQSQIQHIQPDFLIQNYKEQFAMARDEILLTFGISKLSINGEEIANVSYETRLMQEAATLRTREELLRFYARFIPEIYYQWQNAVKLGEGQAIVPLTEDMIDYKVNPYLTEPDLTNERVVQLFEAGIFTLDETRKHFGLEPLDEEEEEEQQDKEDEDETDEERAAREAEEKDDDEEE